MKIRKYVHIYIHKLNVLSAEHLPIHTYCTYTYTLYIYFHTHMHAYSNSLDTA